MKRFTERTIRDDYNNVDIIGVDLTKLYKELDDQQNPTLTFALNKLANLEDIEEEVGIDLITLFKALTNGFFAKDVTVFHLSGELSENQKLDPKYLRLNMWYECIEWENIWNPMDDLHEYYFKDYGKTWALTREELEEKSNETTHT